MSSPFSFEYYNNLFQLSNLVESIYSYTAVYMLPINLYTY
jgi:hypothetical protein